MIEVKNINKNYQAGDTIVKALKNVSITFRDSEFVSILGPSGCGKTTLLNIIGGLDKYTDGDLVVNNTSTKEYKDSDWDAYRNHKVGFVFQSYNLIMHLTVVENVELALSIAGDNKKEKRKKAIDALTKVGLYEQIHKRPNQLSGGQMQRVAIARAIVNNPSIILADEPTGALDSETSVQIMDILQEISKDQLVIMVTHNPELGEKYSNRIIKLLDGEVVGDSNPVEEKEKSKILEEENKNSERQKIKLEQLENERKVEAEKNNKKYKPLKKKKEKKPAMSFFTAFKLSLRNLATKKTRSILTSFAGSIGIIGIALILALSNGFNAYIKKTESDTLSSYPLAITKTSADLTATLEALNTTSNRDKYVNNQEIYVNGTLDGLLKGFMGKQTSNDLKSFKTYLDNNMDESLVNAIQYVYNVNLNVFKGDYNNGVVQLNPFEIPQEMLQAVPMLNMLVTNLQTWQELLNNTAMLNSQYDLLGQNAKWPENENEIVVFVDERNQIDDYYLYALGLRDVSELQQMLMPNAPNVDFSQVKYTFEDIYNLTYTVLPEGEYYKQNQSSLLFEDTRKTLESQKEEYNTFIKTKLDNAIDLKVVGIARPKQGVLSPIYRGGVGYSSKLTEKLIELNNNTDVVKAQQNNLETSVLTGESFNNVLTQSSVLNLLSVADLEDPYAIYFYPTDFDSKDAIKDFISTYNNAQTEESKKIKYNDYVSILMGTITSIVDTITYVLIAFVSISLVVSSIMIGVITYISVIERTKEIGVLRSVGARKKDVSRIFNAETLILGFASGFFGILITLILSVPINLILKSLIGVWGIASVNAVHALILIAISMVLTLVSGLIPSRIAAKKDPVTALRSE